MYTCCVSCHLCHTHSHKDMNKQRRERCFGETPGETPSDVWALLGLEMVISLSNTHSAGSAFQINTQKITSSAYLDTHSFCSPPLSRSLKKKKNHPVVNNDKAGEIFLRAAILTVFLHEIFKKRRRRKKKRHSWRQPAPTHGCNI